MSAAALFCVERELGDHPEPGAETRFLAVDRFHCGPGGAVHREQACQLPILMPGLKCPSEGRFVTLPRVLNRFGARGMEDRRHFFIRQALDTLIANVEARRKKA